MTLRMSSQIVYRIVQSPHGLKREDSERGVLEDMVADIQGLTKLITFTTSDLEISTFMDSHKHTKRYVRRRLHASSDGWHILPRLNRSRAKLHRVALIVLVLHQDSARLVHHDLSI